ncbi:MAG: glycosyltransferase family 2 protein [Nocardioides sp.]|jgi:GT2 family glycosyltransferase|uniref:glycosyltransferase family 2 protein n=1 Tax=Nocardioides sp. TaxID=35761 RepID=UPI0026362A51|nr:glycosyltransferase family 2 protein [Nocardioides sp.]MCW2834718.1 glycosyltransferase family 2 protein [Nocardioides sp.]
MQGVSIVIPHYGDPAPALALIAQLRAADTRVPVQIIVSDDASPMAFPATEGVEVIRRRTNGGFGSAVNTGVTLARQELLLILNSDLEIPPDFVDRMVQASAKYPRAVLSPQVVGHDGAFGWPGRDFPRVRHYATEWLTPLARWRDTKAWHRAVGHDVHASSRDSPVDWVIGAAMLLPVGEFRAVSGFDERFFMNAEEVDLQRRLRDKGVRAIALATPVVVHTGGGSSPSGKRREWLVEARFLYARKWGGERRLRSALTACSVANFAVNCVRRARGSSVAPLVTLRCELALALRRPRGRHG